MIIIRPLFALNRIWTLIYSKTANDTRLETKTEQQSTDHRLLLLALEFSQFTNSVVQLSTVCSAAHYINSTSINPSAIQSSRWRTCRNSNNINVPPRSTCPPPSLTINQCHIVRYANAHFTPSEIQSQPIQSANSEQIRCCGNYTAQLECDLLVHLFFRLLNFTAWALKFFRLVLQIGPINRIAVHITTHQMLSFYNPPPHSFRCLSSSCTTDQHITVFFSVFFLPHPSTQLINHSI